MHQSPGIWFQNLRLLPTIREELPVHDAIMEAMQNLIRDNQNDMAASLQEIILQCTAQQNQGSQPEELRHCLEELNRELDRLLTFAGNDLTDLRIKQISDEMLRLRQQEKQLVSLCGLCKGKRGRDEGGDRPARR